VQRYEIGMVRYVWISTIIRFQIVNANPTSVQGYIIEVLTIKIIFAVNDCSVFQLEVMVFPIPNGSIV
jgi:hypothetical protein